MAESAKRALVPKAPRPAAGAPAGPPVSVRGDPLTKPSNGAPPPRGEDQASTAETNIISGKGSVKSGPPPAVVDHESSTRAGSMAAIHAVPTAGDQIGPYVMDRLLGSGGMGLVVAATHEDTGAKVAIKLLRPKAAGDKIHAERFAREARAIVKIKSPHVVKVLDAGTLESDAPYIVMEYLIGRDLSQALREDGPMPVPRAADIMLQVCDAVASAHAVGVIHRDLKPSNFFLTMRPNGTPHVKVLDFGIAKAIGTDGVVDPNLTETQAVFGSPTYMSPEQIRSAKHVDHRSDIWSIGVALYEITTGRLPFAADNVAGLLASIVADPPYYPRGFIPDLPIVYEEMLLACLHKDPKQRVQSAGDLGIALAPFCTQGPETDALLASITRLSPPTGQPFPGETGPRMPAFDSRPQLPANYTPPPEVQSSSTPSWPGHTPEDHRQSGGIAFGSTGSDLHAALPKPVGRKVIATLGIALGVAVVLLGALGGAYYMKKPVVAATPPTATTATAAPTTPQMMAPVPSADTAPVTSVTPVGSAPATSSSVDPAASGSASAQKPPKTHSSPRHGGTPPKAATPPGATTTGPSKPVDPLNDRF